MLTISPAFTSPVALLTVPEIAVVGAKDSGLLITPSPATGLIVMIIRSVTAGQGPLGSFEVSVNVTVPAAISAAVGV